MKLNCKPGDLAVVVKTKNGKQVGKIVECLKVVEFALFRCGFRAHAWITNPSLLGTDGISTMCPDSWLRPIRDSDREDETLTWAGKPEKKEKETT